MLPISSIYHVYNALQVSFAGIDAVEPRARALDRACNNHPKAIWRGCTWLLCAVTSVTRAKLLLFRSRRLKEGYSLTQLCAAILAPLPLWAVPAYRPTKESRTKRRCAFRQQAGRPPSESTCKKSLTSRYCAHAFAQLLPVLADCGSFPPAGGVSGCQHVQHVLHVDNLFSFCHATLALSHSTTIRPSRPTTLRDDTSNEFKGLTQLRVDRVTDRKRERVRRLNSYSFC